MTSSSLSIPSLQRAGIPDQRGAQPESGDLPSAPSSCSCFDFQYVLLSPQMAKETFSQPTVQAGPLGPPG